MLQNLPLLSLDSPCAINGEGCFTFLPSLGDADRWRGCSRQWLEERQRWLCLPSYSSRQNFSPPSSSSSSATFASPSYSRTDCDRGPCRLNLILKQLQDRSSVLLADFVPHTNNLFKKVSSQLLCFQLVSIAGEDVSKDLDSELRWLLAEYCRARWRLCLFRRRQAGRQGFGFSFVVVRCLWVAGIE
jgi:hypothetical protein